jgi:tetratricopeptide (TPR) repeat protein
MRARKGAVFGLGFSLLCLSCVLVAPGLPLRVALPTSAVLGILAHVIRNRDQEGSGFALGYGLLWMLGCVVGIKAGFDKPAAVQFALGSLGILSILCFDGLRTVRERTSRFDVGTLGGVGMLGWLMTSMAANGRTSSGAGAPLAVYLIGCVILWFAARSVMRTGAVARKGISLGLAVVACANLAGPAGWGLATIRATVSERRASPVSAYQDACVEEGRARRLDIPWAIQRALDRQVRIAENCGNLDLCRTKSRRLVRLDPQNSEAWHWLLIDSLNRKDYEGAIDALGHLPGQCISMRTAEDLGRICVSASDLDRFLKVWKISGGELKCSPADASTWLEWSERCYFGGYRDIAAAFLAQGLSQGQQNWNAVRLLWSIYAETGNFGKANKLLESVSIPAENRAEAAFLRAESARRLSNAQGAKAALEEAVSLEPAYFAARQRLDGTTNATSTSAGLDLLDCHIAAPQIRQGETVKIQMRWLALAPVDPAMSVYAFVREREYGGSFFRTEAGFESLGQDPRKWAIGTDCRCVLEVPVTSHAPAGQYSVLLGVVRDGKRQEVAVTGIANCPVTSRGTTDRIPVGFVQVTAKE